MVPTLCGNGGLKRTWQDIIFVLKDGEVVERGTHEELMRAGGLYYRMWVEQAADVFVEESPEVTE